MQKYANLVELEKLLSNAYFLAKFRFGTAENEPAKKLKKIANFANFAKHRLKGFFPPEDSKPGTFHF